MPAPRSAGQKLIKVLMKFLDFVLCGGKVVATWWSGYFDACFFGVWWLE